VAPSAHTPVKGQNAINDEGNTGSSLGRKKTCQNWSSDGAVHVVSDAMEVVGLVAMDGVVIVAISDGMFDLK
jgi:hypothetical protein